LLAEGNWIFGGIFTAVAAFGLAASISTLWELRSEARESSPPQSKPPQ
jgi:hypothetical protein